MVKSVRITVKSSQTGADQEVEAWELTAFGQARQKEQELYVSYDETSLSGLEGTKTTLKILPDRMTVLRHGPVEAKQYFKEGHSYPFLYQSPYGMLKMAVKTKMFNRMTDSDCNLSLTIELAYDLEVEGQWQSYNTLTIAIQEEMNCGYERTVKSSFGQGL